ncbi:MAG TPA: tripartite tricarboxylate transporter substrate binding protein [Casimicrobiaceae bacterium]|nr:tripartite tricarboxylate transporter substrate binding protein [Casimicrobiaceae bacterium]
MRLLQLVFAACIVLFGSAHAQTWPTRPIRIIVPYPAGGSGDIVARLVAQKMSDGLGQQVVVENRAGANGTIGTEAVAKSPPDGYTLVLATDIQFAISPALGAKLPYDPVKDFEPVSLVAFVNLVLVANPAVKANTMQELVALAQAQPGAINYASTGAGSTHHLSIELLQSMGNFKVTHVPYKGSSQALPDLVANQVQMMQLGVPQSLQFIKQGKLKALGVGSSTRLPSLPDVPTIAEQGFPGYQANNSWNLFAPAGTPAAVINRLQQEVARTVALSEIRERFAADGLQPVGSTAAELAARMRTDYESWSQIVKRIGLKVE